ncbi:MAG: RDD family protein [Elainellaceae cyanobacterium]
MQLFNTVRIKTPESVELELTLAGIGNRAFALLVDYIILNLSLLALGVLTLYLVYSLQLDNLLLGFTFEAQWVIAVMSLVIYSLYVGYFVSFEALREGQTPGKRRANIRVIRDNGQPVGLIQSTLRSLLRPVDDILFVGFLLILVSRQEKRLGDWLAGTLVVQADSATDPQIVLSERAHGLAQQILTEATIAQLLPDDFGTVKEYLQRRSQMELSARARYGLQLADQIRDTLGMAQIPWEHNADLFLEAVYLAYQQQFRGGF